MTCRSEAKMVTTAAQDGIDDEKLEERDHHSDRLPATVGYGYQT